jgi:PBSX family phage terminase large subunit
MISVIGMTEETTIKLSDKVLPGFRNFWRACDKYLKKVLKGGRNSSKSTHISIRIIYDLMRKPVNALVIRKVKNTIETSVYEQLKWAIEYLGVEALWKCKISPFELTYLPRGNKILFRGADEPSKIKSIKTSRFPIAILWVEEEADFKTEEEIDTIVDSVLRAQLPEGVDYSLFFSYNPPKRKQHWLNKKYETQFTDSNTYVHHSTYLGNPYLSKETTEEAENVKKKNLKKYEWTWLGKPIGAGLVPFENLTFRKITDAEIKPFDNIKQGLDWGYAADPLHFLRMHYDKTRRILYFLDEISGLKMSNRDIAEKIKTKGYHTTTTIADSAEPKSVNEVRGYGIKIKGAKKGPGSVEHGEKWLDDLEEIVIDPERTPEAAKEFEAIDYQVDKDGNIINKLEEKDNHSIDACRYGMEDDMKPGWGW